MPKYRCSRCSAKVEALIRLVETPRCRGGATQGRHTVCTMVLIEGTAEITNKPNNQDRKTTIMSKTPDKTCGCYSEPVDGKPGVFQTCGRLTSSRFAPGHDAKLKGRLIAAAVADEPFKTLDEAGKVKTNDPMAMATELGWSKYIVRALEVRDEKTTKAAARASETDTDRAAKVAAKDAEKAERAAARDAAKATRDAEKAAKQADKDAAKAAAPTTTVQPVQYLRVKIGRWTYDDAVVIGRDGDDFVVRYTKGGKETTATVSGDALSKVESE